MQCYDSTKIEEDMMVVRLKEGNFKLPLHINYMRDIQGGGGGGNDTTASSRKTRMLTF